MRTLMSNTTTQSMEMNWVDAASRNVAGIPTMTPSTVKWITQSVLYLCQFLGQNSPDPRQWQPLEIHAWHQQLLQTVSAVTANSYLRGVKTLCARLYKLGHLTDNPTLHIPYAPEPPAQPKAIKLGTYCAMRSAAQTTRDTAIIDTLWGTGCRITELTTMALTTLELWAENDKHCMAIQVRGKFGKARYVYSDAAKSIADWLNERPADRTHALFTTHHGKPLTTNAIQSILRKARISADLPKNTVANAHSFRHAFAIRMLDAGHDISAVSAWLGHEDPTFTARVYVIRREDELRRKYFNHNGHNGHNGRY
jgi:site-specific recombinase XerD